MNFKINKILGSVFIMLRCSDGFRVLIAVLCFSSLVRSEAVCSRPLPKNVTTCLPKKVSETPRTTFEGHLEGSSIIYGLSKVANETLVAEACFKELSQIQKGILRREPWAMKVLDASGSQTPGFLYQNNFWLGSREACATANNPLGLTLSKLIQRNMKKGLVEDVAPFDVEFRVVYLKLHSPWQLPLEFITKPILHVGLCLPASCSCAEVKQLTRELIRQNNFIPAELYEFNADVLYVKDLKLKAEFFERRSLKLLAALAIFTAVMMLSASLTQKPGIVSAKVGNESNSKAAQSEDSENILMSAVKFFDVHRNYQQMFASSLPKKSDIAVVTGLRSISAFLVVVVHMWIFLFNTMSNVPIVLAQHEQWSHQVFKIPFFIVDAFFAISGFLQAFQFFQDIKGIETIRTNSFTQNMKAFLEKLFHRYLRLAPLYFVAICLADLMVAYINDVSLFHVYDRYDEICPKFWWRNLLLIQSYFPGKEMCSIWTWSLSCDMQYSIVGFILLFTYAKQPQLVKYIVGALLPCNVAFILYSGIKHRFQFAAEASYAALDGTYLSPFVRGVPYIVGSIAAWYLLEQQRHLPVSPAVQKWLWKLAPLLLASCSLTMYWPELSYLASMSLYLYGRVAMSLAVSWIIVGSAMGGGTAWSRILAAAVFHRVQRSTYAIYLLHPILLILTMHLSDTSLQITLFMLIVYACGFCAIMYPVSIIFSLAFEAPYTNLSAKMLKRKREKLCK